MIADVNGRGGVFGRKLTPIYAEFKPAGDNGQAQCSTWTRDNKVVAVADTMIGADTLSACLFKARVPFQNSSLDQIDQKVLNRYAPYFHKLTTVSNNTLYPTWVSRLKEQGYFTGWNTSTGAAGTARVRLGLICSENFEATRNGCTDLERILKARGYDVESPYRVGNTAPGNDAVLKFQSAGVTHIFSTTTDVLFFMQAAESQKYRPRYAVTSTNVPNLLASSVPAAQLVGALGVGSAPLADVAAPPPMGPGRARCQKVLRDANVQVDSAWSSQSVAQNLCDAIYLFVEAARAGGGLTDTQVSGGYANVNGIFQPGAVFATGFSTTRFDEPSAVRDLGFKPSCTCFQYLSTTNWPS